MSITANHVTKTYGAQKALNDVSFTISQGEIAAFIGPNGAGKSATLKMLTTVLYLNEERKMTIF